MSKRKIVINVWIKLLLEFQLYIRASSIIERIIIV